MGWIKKVWKDRMEEYPTRRRLNKTDGTNDIVTVSREEGQISQEGDAFSAANMNDLETRINEGFTDVNSNLKKVAYPYTNYTDVTLRGYVSKLQNDPEGKKGYVIFIPTYQSPYSKYGVKTIKSLVIQGVAIIRQNATNQTGYTVTNAVQDYQGIRLSVLTDNDISGYLCDCTFDFYGT